MNDEHANVIAHLAIANPLFAWWALPFVMTQAWITTCLTPAARIDDEYRNEHDGAQLPVPPVLQEEKDRELFA